MRRMIDYILFIMNEILRFPGKFGVAGSITGQLPPPRGVYYFSCQRKYGEMLTELQLVLTLFRRQFGSGLALEKRRGRAKIRTRNSMA